MRGMQMVRERTKPLEAYLHSARQIHLSGAGVAETSYSYFFHSTNLLDLSVNLSATAQAFVDLLDYGALLFADWSAAIIAAPRGLETLETLARLDVQAIRDPSTRDRVNRVLRSQPKNVKNLYSRGAHVAEHPADIHTMLCVV